jgi:hypothetical protein
MSSVFRKHWAYSRQLQALLSRQSRLIVDFHEFKCTRTARGRHAPNDATAAFLYDQCLYRGTKQIGAFDFCSTFRAQMEDVMLAEDPGIGDDYATVYYNQPQEELQHPILLQGPALTPADVQALCLFRRDLAAWMELGLHWFESAMPSPSKTIKAECTKLAASTAKVEAFLSVN